MADHSGGDDVNGLWVHLPRGRAPDKSKDGNELGALTVPPGGGLASKARLIRFE